jgi:hypothetical protein
MVISESLISIIFRGINTLMVVVCAVYAFNKYALVRIKRAMDKKEHELINLRLQATRLGLEIKKIELQIKKEEGNAVHMQEKILKWREVVNAMHKVQIGNQKSSLLNMKVRQATKKAYIHSTYIQEQVAPDAIHQARGILNKHFQSPHAAQQYITDIIECMQASER